MSVETWREEFYPTEAKNCPKESAAMHSRRKWEGLLSKNLRKHKLPLDYRDWPIMLGTRTCALCQYWNNLDMPSNNGYTCKTCPLVLSGHIACGDFHSAYADKNVPRMVKELKSAELYQLKNA